MSDGEAYVQGYRAAIRDIDGPDLAYRVRMIFSNIEAAAIRSRVDPHWLDNPSPADARPWSSPSSIGAVYLARADDRIKIGFTTRAVHSRLRALSTTIGREIHLLATYPGTRELEAALHRKFDDLRIRGEWFQDHDRIHRWIESWQK